VTRHGAARWIAPILAAAMLAGCGDAPALTPVPTPEPTSEPTPITTTYELGATVWYEGLLIHVDSAVAILDARGGPVEVRLRIENPNADDGELNGRILLKLDATSLDPPIEPTRESQVPSIPANGTADAVLTYELQGVASVEGAVLQIGEKPLHVASVPLTAASGELVNLEPVPLVVAGAGAAGTLRITLRSGLLRWDLPDWSQELPDDLQSFTLTYDVTYTGSFTGGFAFTGENVTLRLPDGTSIGPRRDGHSQSIELIGPGLTKKGLFSRFEIPDGMTGRFALVLHNGSASKNIPFILGG
jgi:hypothetical protein